ncbi:hypothetical protein CH305_18395 [Rhodococcus sp. 15-649-2-2]|uniref:hypothetical protein n=1 Tax=Rhodococcus sp. 15-649-2-2 TaxID=2023140 RepID=UPI000B9B75BF|nr:hypothetical protein [Rhodococcus sp. 15-649-2-2]OZE77208.1 hypothetical protein CH305_18395 [Rhodococcus sp. 15-649-2-2]
MIGPSATLSGAHADPLTDQSEWTELVDVSQIPYEMKVAMLEACASASRAVTAICGIDPEPFVTEMCDIAAQSMDDAGVLPMDSRDL